MNDICIYEDTKYKMAFKEVLVILNNIPKSDYKKIPNDIIEILKSNQDHSYNFSLEPRKSINNQKISDLAKAIIENFYRDYWVTDAEKQKILQEENHKREKIEDEKREKYNPDDIFKKKKEDKIKYETTEETSIAVIKEEKWYKKIYNLIKNIFKKTKKGKCIKQ